MTTPQELVSALRERKAKIAEMRQKLDAIDKEKEQWFSAKNSFSSRIKGLIRQIRDLKEKRDSLTKDVRGLKQKRDSTQKELKAAVPPEKGPPIDRDILRINPGAIRAQMDRIETTIETGGISFEKEKQLMVKMRALKKDYALIVEAKQAAKEQRDKREKAHDLGKEAESYHLLVVHKAGESQKVHEQVVALAKQIDELKPEEKEALQKFLGFKKQFSEEYARLKAELVETDKIKAQLDAMDAERSRSRQQRERQSLDDLQKSVEEKIKSKKKLTNEDLLIFQKAMRGK
ncbi:TPA: hypothetical protein HA281_03975 [Candidatus Woesearchaeota archaeon]|nr:MAG: hypothetical protein QT04_C0032G0004 [archaeon GW2011_AR11]HIH05138.1 hypothetical protein [Candidatus Woesearchaeota archaeon]HIH91936.1 hypothetical protein [Candidatus Woesearchaeota archaeon]